MLFRLSFFQRFIRHLSRLLTATALLPGRGPDPPCISLIFVARFQRFRVSAFASHFRAEILRMMPSNRL
jgi:hypothetical protein